MQEERRILIMLYMHAVEMYNYEICADFALSRQGENKAIDRSVAYRILREAAEQANITEIGTHTLRKPFSYHFYKQTKDVAILQGIFNHSSPDITLRYIGINQDNMDSAMMKFKIKLLKYYCTKKYHRVQSLERFRNTFMY